MTSLGAKQEINDLICETIKQQISDLLSTQVTLTSYGDYVDVTVVLRYAGRDISDSTATMRLPDPTRY